MGALEDLAKSLLEADTTQAIATENPYINFMVVPETLGTSATKLAAADPSSKNIRDAAIISAVSGLLGGTLKGFAEDYQSTLTDRFRNSLFSGQRAEGLSDALWTRVQNQRELMKAANFQEILNKERDLEYDVKLESAKSNLGRDQDLFKAYLANPNLFRDIERAGGSADIFSSGRQAPTELPRGTVSPDDVFAKPPKVDTSALDELQTLSEKEVQLADEYQLNGYSRDAAVDAAKQMTNTELEIEKKDYERFVESRDRARNILRMADQADMALQTGLKTGAGAEFGQFAAENNPFLLGIPSALGYGKERAAAGQLITQLQADAMRYSRPAGVGQQSDLEAKKYIGAFPTLDKEVESNKFIIDKIRNVAQRDLDYSDFVDTVRERGGTIAQANTLWRQYERANPFIVENERGYFVPNQNITSYQDFFGLETEEGLEPVKAEDIVMAPEYQTEDTVRPTILGEYVKGAVNAPKDMLALFNPGTYKAMVTDEEGFSAEQTARTVGTGAAMLAGGIKGGAIGAVGGPIGAAVGAGIGAGLGWLGFNTLEDAVTTDETPSDLIPTREEIGTAASIAGGSTAGIGVAKTIGRAAKGVGTVTKGIANKARQTQLGTKFTDLKRGLQKSVSYYDDLGNELTYSDDLSTATTFKDQLTKAADTLKNDTTLFENIPNDTKATFLKFKQGVRQSGKTVDQAHLSVDNALEAQWNNLPKAQQQMFALKKNPATGKGGFNPDFSKAQAVVNDLKKVENSGWETAQKMLNAEKAAWNKGTKSYAALVNKKQAYGAKAGFDKPTTPKEAAGLTMRKAIHNVYNESIHNVAEWLSKNGMPEGDALLKANKIHAAYKTFERTIQEQGLIGRPNLIRAGSIARDILSVGDRLLEKYPATIMRGAETVAAGYDRVSDLLKLVSRDGKLLPTPETIGIGGQIGGQYGTEDSSIRFPSASGFSDVKKKMNDEPSVRASDQAIELLKEVEGFSKTAYPDAEGYSIGYGHFGAKPGQKITDREAEDLLEQDVQTAEDIVNQYVKVPLSQNQFDALVSFAYNVGEGQFATSTLLKALNSGDFESVPTELSRWVYSTEDGQKQKNDGLLNRRKREIELFMKTV